MGGVFLAERYYLRHYFSRGRENSRAWVKPVASTVRVYSPPSVKILVVTARLPSVYAASAA